MRPLRSSPVSTKWGGTGRGNYGRNISGVEAIRRNMKVRMKAAVMSPIVHEEEADFKVRNYIRHLTSPNVCEE